MIGCWGCTRTWFRWSNVRSRSRLRTLRFQTIADAFAALPKMDLIPDGEAVVAHSRGIPDSGCCTPISPQALEPTPQPAHLGEAPTGPHVVPALARPGTQAWLEGAVRHTKEGAGSVRLGKLLLGQPINARQGL